MKASANLDLLRAIAVCLVLLSHIPGLLNETIASFNHKALGRAGVALFFVHTTLVLLMSLQRHGPDLWPFLVRRFFRIYPLAIVAVLTMAALKWAADQPRTAAEIVSNLLLVQNLTGHDSWPDPLWTLPYEVQMYLLLPALYLFTRVERPLVRMVSVYIAALAFAASMWGLSRESLLVGFVPCFLPGAIAFLLLQLVKPSLSPLALFATVALGLAVISQQRLSILQEVPYLWGLCLAVALVIPLCREIAFGPLALVASQVARYSYGIYLTHIFVGAVLMGSGSWYVKLPVFAVLQAVVAVVAYKLIEAPGIRLGSTLASRMQDREVHGLPPLRSR